MTSADFLHEIRAGLLRDRLRVGLTMAGIAVGCFSVAILLSLGAAIKTAIGRSMNGLGERLVIVTPERLHGGAAGSVAAAAAELSEGDAAALRRLASIRQASALLSGRVMAATALDSVATNCLGIDRDYATVVQMEMDEGEGFGEGAAQAARPVVILGAATRQRLFGDGVAVGRTLSLDGRRLQVAGVARTQGLAAGATEADDFVLVPKAFARQQLMARPAPASVDAIFLRVADGVAVDDAIADVEEALQGPRHLPELAQAIAVNSLKGLMGASLQAADLLTLLMGGMAAVSVLVGGVGIVNVMLANLAERRVEIGLKLALGAPPAVIGLEFLAAAVVLAICGALIGLGLAQLLALALAGSGVLAVTITAPAALLSTGLAVGVGIAAGTYPAACAAQLNPREILRDA